MTEKELLDKVEKEIYEKIKIVQHDFTKEEDIVDLGFVKVGGINFPVLVNRRVLDADYIIGLGNIIPHSDAGFSGGGKIIQPGICGAASTSATHIAGALMEEIPLGNLENNLCRKGIDEVAKKVGLKFIINVVLTPQEEVIGVFAGDMIKAHWEGAELSRKVYGVRLPELADIVVVSSSPCDIDYWQAEKGLAAAYFAVKKDGIIIFAAPCYEGLEHNHPKLREWAKYSYKEACKQAVGIPYGDKEADLVAADIAMANSRVREKARILIISEHLSKEDIKLLGYESFEGLQEAVDFALREKPGARIGLLPRGGDSLPYIYKGEII
ncbi:MAG TPA: lactate racemase domain-containing protein [Negativicutes bacterium]|nr:lactate racemase domain-containing protein [Negativicutes bacterium]